MTAFNEKKRDVTFDIMKGIGIILVVLGHVQQLDFYPLKTAIYTFHMPLFFILAGYLIRYIMSIYGNLLEKVQSDYCNLMR